MLRGVDLVDLGLDALDGRHALLAASHQDDALDDVVVVVVAGDAKPRLVADAHRGDVADQHRRALVGRQHGVADVVERVDLADAAYHRRLRADVDRLAADVDVAVAERLQHLRQREAVGGELGEIDG